MKNSQLAYDMDGNLLTKLRMPIDLSEPCSAQGGWFYVNRSSIDFVTPDGEIGRILEKQMVRALALMRNARRRSRARRARA